MATPSRPDLALNLHAALLALFTTAAPAAVLAQVVGAEPAEVPAPGGSTLGDEDAGEADGSYEVEAVVVTAERQRGAVIGDIAPEVQLDARDIRALGVGNLTELLEALGPQLRSGRGREQGPPVVLLNGRRISGFGEIRGIPPEAIERVDILPEEVALKYGYRADQRVVNFVLRERFRAVTAQLEAGGSTAGGREGAEASINVLRISRDRRSSLDLEYEHSEPLLENERNIIRSAPSAPFDLRGNITAPVRGGEIDPALTALTGEVVTVAGVPVTAGVPALSDFAATAELANLTDLGPYRTLRGRSDQATLNGTIARAIWGDVSTTLNARLDLTSGESRFGLPTATLTIPDENPFSPFGNDVVLFRYLDEAGALTRNTESATGHVGLAANGRVSDWRWSLTANYDLTRSITQTDRGFDTTALQAALNANDPAVNPFGEAPSSLLDVRERDRAQTTNGVANAELVVNGVLRELPAGALSSTFTAEVEALSFESESRRSGVETLRDLSRERGGLRANIDIPIASRRREILTSLGDLTANLNIEANRLSDFGDLYSLGYGVNWSPIKKLSVIASVTEEEGAPSVQQLGAPVLLTPNVAVFDFRRGETVDVTRIEGGAPLLVADSRRVLKLGTTLRPYEERDLSLSMNYTSSRIDDQISSFPTATAEIEAAFPDRFVRDPEGRLLSVDSRPVNFARAEREEIRTGLNYSRPLPGNAAAGSGGGRARLGPAEPGAPGALAGSPAGESGAAGRGEGGAPVQARAGLPGGAAGGGPQGPGGGFGRGGFGGRGGGAGRLQFAVYHTYRLMDEILIREGVPVLDLLNGSASGSGGGQPRHEVDLQAGLSRNGLGGRLEARWRSETFVRGDAARVPGSTGDLFFSDLTTVNLRLFADLGQREALVRERPWLRGARISLALNNLFDQRVDVRDSGGLVPISYQPDLLDPIGRSVRLSVRKLFAPRPAVPAPRGGGGSAPPPAPPVAPAAPSAAPAASVQPSAPAPAASPT
ncbi:MAG: TonB-dependent receptor [Proteobacteria bacterium]|nr:TonB-dependent receptor [Pseudomonadota bacterium]